MRLANRPYALWAAVFAGTVLAVVLAVSHVFSTLKSFTYLQELLYGPASRQHSELICSFYSIVAKGLHW